MISAHKHALPIIDDLSDSHNAEAVKNAIAVWQQIFVDNNIEAGDTVALLLHNRVEFIEVVLAGLSFGICVVPLNWHLNVSERDTLLQNSHAKLLITESVFVPDLSLVSVSVVILEKDLPTDRVDRVMSKDIQANQAGSIMLFTGGTTGLPKAVKRSTFSSLPQLIKAWQQLGLSCGLDGEGTHLVTGPLYHAAPLYFALYDFLNGARLVIMPRWDAEQALQLIDSRSITHTHLVPTQMVRLLRLANEVKARYSTKSLKLVLLGAAPIARDIKKQVIDWWGPVLLEYWGGSESGLCTKINSQRWLEKPGSVGTVVHHYQLKIVDPVTFKELKEGETGLILIQHESRNLPFTYYGIKEPVVDGYPSGWFDLGDMGYLDEEGYLFLSDRVKNKIISGGVNIYPAEIENVLFEVESVIDAVVIGLPDSEWGELPVALLQVRDGCEQNILQLLQEKVSQLSKFKRPAKYYIVENLPRTPTGKINTENLLGRLLNQQFIQEIQ